MVETSNKSKNEENIILYKKLQAYVFHMHKNLHTDAHEKFNQNNHPFLRRSLQFSAGFMNMLSSLYIFPYFRMNSQY